MTAYVCRFVINLKLRKKGDEFIVGKLRVAEICEAEKIWKRYEQSVVLKEEEKFRKLTSSLNLFYNNEQLLRLNTRLNRSTQLHYENKNPLLRRRDSHISKLIVLHYMSKCSLVVWKVPLVTLDYIIGLYEEDLLLKVF